jgi:hypothetical protein
VLHLEKSISALELQRLQMGSHLYQGSCQESRAGKNLWEESLIRRFHAKVRRSRNHVLQDLPLASKASIASPCGGKGDDAGAETSGAAIDALSTAVKLPRNVSLPS